MTTGQITQGFDPITLWTLTGSFPHRAGWRGAAARAFDGAGGAYLEVRAGSAQLGERDEAFGAGEAVGPAEHGKDGADRVERVPAVELAWGGVCVRFWRE